MKTNSQLPSEPRNQRHFLSFVLEEGGKKHFWLLIVEECLSKLWSYQAQSVARAGGRCMHLGEVGERDFVGDSEGMGSKNGEERASPSAQILPLLLSDSLTPSHLLSLLLAQASVQLCKSHHRNSFRSGCVTNVNCVLTLMVWKYFSAGRYILKPAVSSCLEH